MADFPSATDPDISRNPPVASHTSLSSNHDDQFYTNPSKDRTAAVGHVLTSLRTGAPASYRDWQLAQTDPQVRGLLLERAPLGTGPLLFSSFRPRHHEL